MMLVNEEGPMMRIKDVQLDKAVYTLNEIAAMDDLDSDLTNFVLDTLREIDILWDISDSNNEEYY